MAINYGQQQWGEDVFEDYVEAPTVSDADIRAFVEANIGNPALIAETAAQYGVSVDDLSRATGYDTNIVVDYFQQADVAPPLYTPPAVEAPEPPRPPEIFERPEPPAPPDEPIYEPPPPPEEPVYEPPRPPERPPIEEPPPRPPVIVERPEPPPPPPIKEIVEAPRPPTREIVEPPPRPEEPPPKTIYEPKIVDLGDGTFMTPGGNIIDKDGYPVTTPVDTPPTAVVTPPKTYTQTEVNDALTNLLATDPNAKRSDVTALAATVGITADQVNAAYSNLPVNKPTVVDKTEDTSTDAVAETPASTTTSTTTGTTTGTTKAADTTTAASTLPTLTDHQGNQYDGAQLLTLAQQIAQNAGSMTGGAFQTKGENIGFAATEANNLLGRTATASEQVLLDMARQLIQTGVTDLSQLKTQDITSSGVSVQLDPETNQYYALIPSADGETSTRKELTPDQIAKIKTEEIYLGGDNGTQIQRTIDDLVTGKGLFANGKLLTAQDAVDNPIAYTIGSTYTGGGGTSYDLKFDPKTGKSVVSANGFTTSDADTIMPIIMIASNFLLPGVGSMLTSTLVEAGMSEIVSQVVSKSIINGVTSGIMAEASGGDFGDGFLKGSITGAISAGVAPMISTALPSDLSPAVSSALTKAGTAAITALATGKDVGTAIGTQLLNSAVGTGLSSVTGEMGLSTADAKLLNSVLTPVVTQLVTNGNVNDATLMNAVMLAGSTILANVDSGAVGNVSTLTTGSDTDKVVGGLNLLATETGNETLTDLASTVGTGLGAVSTATGLLNKATSLTNTPKTKVNTTKANLTGALRTNKPTTTRTAAVKPAALNTLNKAKTTTAVKPAALGALNTAKKTISAQQMSQMKTSKPPVKVNVANLTPIKKSTPPQKVDVKTLIPVKKAQLPAGLNTKKMG
jgi:hypothetical protein